MASRTERLNYFHLLQVLDDFERTVGMQQARGVDPDDGDNGRDDMQSLTIQLGSRLKCSIHFQVAGVS